MTTILLNRRAGLRGFASLQRVRALAEEVGFDGPIVVIDPRSMSEELRRLAAQGEVTIGLAGGDGTMSTAADVLAGTAAAMLPIPTGTLNHFARRIGYLDARHAIRSASSAHDERVAVGLVDDRVFLNTATFGLYARVVRRRERLRRYLGKLLGAAVAFGLTLARLERFDLVVQIEGEYLRRSTPLLWVGVGWGSFPRVLESPERRAAPDLEIVVLRTSSRLASVALLVRLTRDLLRGDRPVRDPSLEIIHARSLLIHASHPIDVTIDGEAHRCDPPLLVGILDEAVRVVAPVDPSSEA